MILPNFLLLDYKKSNLSCKKAREQTELRGTEKLTCPNYKGKNRLVRIVRFTSYGFLCSSGCFYLLWLTDSKIQLLDVVFGLIVVDEYVLDIFIVHNYFVFYKDLEI